MTTGWILTVKDLVAKDTASKLCMVSENEIAEKVIRLREKGGVRVQVIANTPYIEVSLDKRSLIKISGSELNQKLIMRNLGRLDPLVIETKETEIIIEIDKTSDEELRDLILSSNNDVSISLEKTTL